MPTATSAPVARRSRSLNLRGTDVSLVAIEAAIDLENYLAGKCRELNSIKVLVDTIDLKTESDQPVGGNPQSDGICAIGKLAGSWDFPTIDVFFRALSYAYYGREMSEVYREPAIPELKTVSDVEREMGRVVGEFHYLLDYRSFETGRSSDSQASQLKLDLMPAEPEREKLLKLSKFCVGLSRACMAKLSEYSRAGHRCW